MSNNKNDNAQDANQNQNKDSNTEANKAAPAQQNYYEQLGVKEDASEREIKKAYHAKMLESHPDKNVNQDAHSKAVNLNEAKEVLMDPEKRKEYDQSLAASRSTNMQAPNAEATQEAKAEVPKEAKAEAPKETKAEVPKEAKAEVPKEAKAEVPKETKAEVSREAKAEDLKEARAEAPKEAKAEAPKEAKAETAKEAKAEAGPIAKSDDKKKADNMQMATAQSGAQQTPPPKGEAGKAKPKSDIEEPKKPVQQKKAAEPVMPKQQDDDALAKIMKWLVDVLAALLTGKAYFGANNAAPAAPTALDNNKQAEVGKTNSTSMMETLGKKPEGNEAEKTKDQTADAKADAKPAAIEDKKQDKKADAKADAKVDAKPAAIEDKKQDKKADAKVEPVNPDASKSGARQNTTLAIEAPKDDSATKNGPGQKNTSLIGMKK